MEKLLFKDWESLAVIGACALLSYITLFVFIRISGKRTLAKLNAFDFVVTVSLGSTLSSMILGKVTLAEGALALLIIIGLQYLLAWSTKKSETLEKVINSTPMLLFYNGNFLEDAMEKELITKEEIYAAIREYRLQNVNDVHAVVLELNGDLAVIRKSVVDGRDSLNGLHPQSE